MLALAANERAMSCFSMDLHGIVRVFGLLAVVWVVEVGSFGEVEGVGFWVRSSHEVACWQSRAVSAARWRGCHFPGSAMAI